MSVVEAKKVTVEVVRDPAGKIVLKIWEQIKTFWFCSKVFRLNGKSSAVVFKNSGTHQNVLVLFQSF